MESLGCGAGASMGVIGAVMWARARTHWVLRSILLIWTVKQLHRPKASPFKQRLSPAPDKWKRAYAGIHLFVAQLDSESRNILIPLLNAILFTFPLFSRVCIHLPTSSTPKHFSLLSQMSHIRDSNPRENVKACQARAYEAWPSKSLFCFLKTLLFPWL